MHLRFFHRLTGERGCVCGFKFGLARGTGQLNGFAGTAEAPTGLSVAIKIRSCVGVRLGHVNTLRAL
jgi:hypothetical protein